MGLAMSRTWFCTHFPAILPKSFQPQAAWGTGASPSKARLSYKMLCLRQRRHRRRWYLKGADNTPYEKIGDEVRSLADEVPFDIPDSWEWVRLGSIVYNRGQITPSTDFCYIDIGSIDNKNQKLNPTDTVIAPDKAPSRARKLVDKGDVLYSTVRPYLHNMCIVDRDFSCIPIASTGFAVLTCHAELCNKFLLYYMMSPDFDAYANNTDNAKGVAYPAINDDRLYKALIPIPPLGEQFRIVSAIESVDASIRDYGVRKRHSAPSMVPSQSPSRSRFYKRQFRVSWYRKTHLTSLQRLCWSVSGWKSSGSSKRAKSKRTSTNPSFSDGIILIMKSVVPEEVCIDEEIPFEIPDNWAWARLSSFGVFSSGKNAVNVEPAVLEW
ncbi:MAG: restriction endonuclease subunit S [Dysosmobacter sp.]